MLISALQMQPVSGDIAANLARITQAAESAAGMGASLLVTPELSLSGYAAWRDFPALAEPVDGPSIKALQALADRLDLAITAGFPERDGADIYNSAVTVRPRAAPVVYRKVHLYGPKEKAAFSPSTAAPQLFDLAGVPTGMLICYDVEFPEMCRGLALAGAELVIVPTALPAGASARLCSEILVPTRAMENQIFVVYADLCGTEGKHRYEGRSVIAGPDGEALARAGHHEALLTAEMDRAGFAAVRAENPYLADRQPGVYAGWRDR